MGSERLLVIGCSLLVEIRREKRFVAGTSRGLLFVDKFNLGLSGSTKRTRLSVVTKCLGRPAVVCYWSQVIVD